MPYTDEGVYKHEVDVPSGGDTLRVAAFKLAYAIETYLFDHNRPGYDNKAFLDWSLQHFMATHQSSGMMANAEFRWNPAAASLNQYETHTNSDKNHDSWTRQASDGVTRYSQDAQESDDIDTSAEVKGEAELYERNEVTEPWMASLTNDNAVVVPPRSHDDVKATDTSKSRVNREDTDGKADAEPESSTSTASDKAPRKAAPKASAEEAQKSAKKKDDVIETPADEYKPVDGKDDK